MNKADNKCSAVCTQHTVSSAPQQISSTSQVHNVCKTQPVIDVHKTDTLGELFVGRFSADESVYL